MSENENIIKKENTGEKKNQDEIVKITISKDAEQKLAEVLDKVCDGFTAGKVNRQDLASWAILRFAEDCNADLIKAIRQDHFNEFALLESILKRSKEDGKLPSELSNALRQHLGLEASHRKPGKKALTTNYINDVVTKDDKTPSNEKTA